MADKHEVLETGDDLDQMHSFRSRMLRLTDSSRWNLGVTVMWSSTA